MKEFIAKIKKQIIKYNTIILLRHTNPDGDALGSTQGLGLFLKSIFPNKRFLANGDRHKNYLNFLAPLPQATEEDYLGALVIVCDTANRERIDSKHTFLAEKIIKIDHHPEVDPYGDINWVESNRIAAAEMVVELVKSYNQPIPTPAAINMFVGIVTDSNRFVFPNTTGRTLMLAGYLSKYIDNMSEVYAQLYQTNIKTFALRSKIMNRLQVKPSGLGYATFNQKEIDALGTDYFTIKSMVNIFSNISQVKIWMVAVDNYELNNVKVSIRCGDDFDVSGVATKYNGGGHASAVGCWVKDWDEFSMLVADLEVLINNSTPQKIRN